jgi:hypothetical protein
MQRRGFFAGLVAAWAVWRGFALAQQSPSFDDDVRPLLEARCGQCHNSRKRSGKLNLETAIGIARGGESGHVVVAGKLEESRLWQRIADEEMPPDEPLSQQERAILHDWIAAGAHGLPTGNDVGHAGDGADHWAFQPLREQSPPPVQEVAKAPSDIDRFVLARLERAGLTLAAEADRATLIRRVSFDLTGLPPRPEEVATFLADASTTAYEQMVDRYLASPHYGERWGRHWLDAAGYADSNGYFNADTDRPLAYRYRDYVVRSFNADKPFDQFITEQLAGDELAGYRPDCDVTPDVVDLYVATHFLRNAQDGTDSSDGNPDELLLDRFTVLEGTVQIIGSSLLGLTLQCARCHDHKFEPVTQKEYYQLQAIFLPGYCPDQWVKAADRVLTIGTRNERAENAQRMARVVAEIDALRESLAAAEKPLRKQLVAEQLSQLDESERSAILACLDKPEAEKTLEEKSLLEKHKHLLVVDHAKLSQRFAEFAAFRQSTDERIKQLEASKPAPLEKIALFTEVTANPPAHHVLIRGGYRQLGEEVGPGVPAVLCDRGAEQTDRQYFIPPKVDGQYSSGRRLALARWLTSPRHPLFARITVNRIWQHHFGTGIVATSDNFGYTGAAPTHPELLDYLALRLIESGWSTKAVHRLILRSATYRQSSAPRSAALAVDPNNELLWRHPLRRLDAESIRDAMLAASGELDATMGGPYVPTVRQADGSVVVQENEPGARRRSLYLQQRRTQMLSFLETFDAPGMVTNCSRRTMSTVPLQSLSLLNSDFLLARANALARRVAREVGGDADARLSQAFLLTLGRAPSEPEREVSRAFLSAQAKLYAGQPEQDALAWRDLAQMLFASNAFLYVE